MLIFSPILSPGGGRCAACCLALGAWQTDFERTSRVIKSPLWLLQTSTLYNTHVSWASSSLTSDFFLCAAIEKLFHYSYIRIRKLLFSASDFSCFVFGLCHLVSTLLLILISFLPSRLFITPNRFNRQQSYFLLACILVGCFTVSTGTTVFEIVKQVTHLR